MGRPGNFVASTKAYSTQLAVIYLLALYIGEQLGKFTQEQLSAYIAALEKLPEQIDEMLKHKENIQFFASKYFNASDMYFIGRNVDYAASLEASLNSRKFPTFTPRPTPRASSSTARSPSSKTARLSLRLRPTPASLIK